MKASQGKRLAYEPVIKNWSAGCVYRGLDNTLYGFASTNERTNGIETIYEFICTNDDVTYYLNGDKENEVKRKQGEPFRIQAKMEGEGKNQSLSGLLLNLKKCSNVAIDSFLNMLLSFMNYLALGFSIS